MYRAWLVELFVCVLFALVPALALDSQPSLKEEGRPPSGAEPCDASVYPCHRVHELADRALDHWLRGDWEPPNALLLSFAEEWSDSLAYLIASALDQAQVTLLVDPTTTTQSQIQRWFQEFNLPAEEVHVRWIRLDSSWVRDYGPLQLLPARGYHGDPIWLDTEYVPERQDDDAVPSALAPELGVEIAASPLPLQGGAIISNGRGLCAVTIEYCLEMGIDFEDAAFMDSLLEQVGCQVVALLPDLRDDPTRHVDMFAQFLAEDVVAVARVEGPENAEDASRMDEAALGLQEAAERLGMRLRVIRIPMPYFGAGKYLTYLNGLRLPESFMVPSYRDAPDEMEAAAYSLLSEALPGTGLVTVPADKIISRSGSLHCISLGLTLPDGVKRPALPGGR
jgi:agmatine/peptidylarginine deiminase